MIGSELVQKYVGEGARMVRELFQLARSKKACIVFFDEVDAVGGARFDDGAGGDNEVQRTMLEIVNQLDGFDARGNVKVLMATNRPDTLDPALLRPGRLDRKVRARLRRPRRALVQQSPSRLGPSMRVRRARAPPATARPLAPSPDEHFPLFACRATLPHHPHACPLARRPLTPRERTTPRRTACTSPQVEFGLPDLEGRAHIFSIHARSMNCDRDIRFELLARLCPNTTGADIRSVCIEAGMFAIRGRRKAITEKDMIEAVNKVVKGYAKFSATPKYMTYN